MIMKIKVIPEDFVVVEVPAISISQSKKQFRVYRLEKRQWDTIDLLDLLNRRLHLAKNDISVAGMKDRYGSTSQLLCIKDKRDLPQKLEDKNFSLTALGYSEEKLSAALTKGNLFTITLRALDKSQEKNYLHALEEVKTSGFPNYYDEQRFGAARHGQGFMGKALFLGNSEQALKLYLWPSKHDRKREKEFKRFCRNNWGNWKGALTLAPPKYRRIVEFLSQAGHGRSYTAAVNLIDRRLLVLMLNGYQSFLFNLLLALFIRELGKKEGLPLKEYKLSYHTLCFYQSLPDSIKAGLVTRKLPVPGFDTHIRDQDLACLLAKVLEQEEIGLGDLKVKKLVRAGVRGVERPAIVIPQDLALLNRGDDELFPGKLKLTLQFFLGRGSYATMLLKRMSLP
jgi:tRNA pseudouridine13 synthase